MYLGPMYSLYRDYNKKSLCLFDLESKPIFFEQIPKNFTISTNSGSSKFNIEMLSCTSPVILQFLNENPNNFNYQLKIADKTNVLGKFEQLYKGDSFTIQTDDKYVYSQIKSKLHLESGSFLNLPNNNSYSNEASISLQVFATTIQTNFPFIIKTNKNEYKCNHLGIYSSSVISEFVKSNPQSNVYFYDFPDEFDEFQQICDFFNFKKILLTTNNMKSIKKISIELNITVIIKQLGTILEDYDKFSQKLDENQDSISEINDLFDLLQNIDKITVNSVKNSIIESKWCETKEKVQELAAFILKSIESNLLIHQHLIDLLIELNSESTNLNELKILIPFIKNKLKQRFGSSIQNCSFVYKLYKRGIISKKFVEKQLKKEINSNNKKYSNLNTESNFKNIFENNLDITGQTSYIKAKSQIILWFLPEIIELENNYNQIFIDNVNELISSFINFYIKNIDIYKQMRDNGEPLDEITLALRYDDVDKFQSIISIRNEMNKKTDFVPFNIFEEFVPNGETNYLNYSAAYGSIKCFKYLLLNHEKIDNKTFLFAVYGGNIEIIRIVDQQLHTIQNNTKRDKFDIKIYSDTLRSIDNDFVYTIVPSIIKHQNNLFDWILEKKLLKEKMDFDKFSDLIKISLEFGNAHSFFQLFDNFFEYTKQNKIDLIISKMISTACKNGFYSLISLILEVFDIILPNYKQFLFNTSSAPNYSTKLYFIKNKYFNDPLALTSNSLLGFKNNYTFEFGNLSIFKLFIHEINQDEFEKILSYFIYKKNNDFIEYFFDFLVKENIFKIRKEAITNFLICSTLNKSDDLFDFIFEKIKLINPKIFEDFVWPMSILINSSYNKNIKVSKLLTELILKQRQNDDFLYPFINAISTNSVELINFFIERKVFVSFDNLFNHSDVLTSMNSEVFSILIKIIPEEILENLYTYLLISAINKSNANLVEDILKVKTNNKIGLFEAILNNNHEIIKILLKYNNKPSFINHRIPYGTPLNLAARINDIETVKILLSIKGIDVNLYDTINGNTPLLISILSKNIEIAKLLIEYPATNINFKNNKNETALTIAAQNNLDTIVDLLLNHEDFDKIDSIFNYAFYVSTDEVTNKLIKSKYFDVNDTMFKYENWPFSSKNLNNNSKNNDDINDTLLIYSTKRQNKKIVDIIINHPNFDKNKSKLNNAVYLSINNKNDLEIFRKLYKLADSDLTNYSILSAITTKSDFYNTRTKNNNNDDSDDNDENNENDENKITISEVLSKPGVKFSNNDIISAFDDLIKKRNNTEIVYQDIRNLIEYDKRNQNCINVNKTFFIGRTAFTLFDSNYRNEFDGHGFSKYIEFLLEIGCDPNIPDTFETYPLQHLFNVGEFSSQAILTLLNSNKVDLSIKIPIYTKKKYSYDPYSYMNATRESTKEISNHITYLHLAARYNNPIILKEFLDKKLIDVNILDDNGNTPLIEACRSKRQNNIDLLFKVNNLDYLHCNNDGDDALKILNPSLNINNESIKSKKDYYLCLMGCFKKKKPKKKSFDDDYDYY